MDNEKKEKRKWSRGTAGVLAILLGSFGAHKFYQGRWKAGILYLLFFWTGIPGIIATVEGVSLLCGDEGAEESYPETAVESVAE